MPVQARFFSSQRRPDQFWGAHPASYLAATGVKRPGREADHTLPTSAEVKETWTLYIHSPHMSSWRSA
jgi:hypothetical protein